VGPENFTKYKDWGYVVSSATAEVFADIALCPWEATKVRMQTSAAGTFPTTLGAGMGKIVSAEGFGGLYKGLVPLWSRQIPYTIMKVRIFLDDTFVVVVALTKMFCTLSSIVLEF
jgi:solute carrier family 25 phosphate transporter 3